MTKPKISKCSQARIESFIDDFIRSEWVQIWTSEKENDWINEPERTARVWKAAEYGAGGSTHAETIEDWREAFQSWMSNRKSYNGAPRFQAAVEAHFDAVEEWHEKNGSLHQEIG